MLETYRDFYGCKATIRSGPKGCRLTVKDEKGKTIRSSPFKTHRGAMRAMGNESDGWRRIDKGDRWPF